MTIHSRLVVSVVMSLLFVFYSSFSQNKKVSLSGYQEFKWGMSRTTVESILHRNGASIASSNSKEITVKSTIEFEGLLYSIDIDKSFMFLNNSLGKVVLSYHQNPYYHKPLDSIYSRFHSQIRNKYGKPYYDTLTTDYKMNLRLTIWRLQGGGIDLTSLEFPESSEYHDKEEIKAVVEGITLIYSKTGFESEIERDKKKRTAKEF